MAPKYFLKKLERKSRKTLPVRNDTLIERLPIAQLARSGRVHAGTFSCPNIFMPKHCHALHRFYRSGSAPPHD
ncbi:hypothetical protein J2Z19_004703 [Ensifer adhaerens]|uniref:Uncharacterized protein n=1 Tax=Ensifer adhaerens TaxID=106592 RepID=A0ACC5T1M7_ENSAD|nr:hypothetical protein [Ensifer adhaerens]MBP1874970.1 hypothetical protein [Ensifer adhaerens]